MRGHFAFVAAALLASVALIAAWTAIIVRSNDLGDLARANCEAINMSNQATADTFRLLQQFSSQNPPPRPRTEEETARIDAFFDQVFDRLKPIPCE